MSVAVQAEDHRTTDVIGAAAADIAEGASALPTFRTHGLLEMAATGTEGTETADPRTVLYAIEEIAYADGSAGWLLAAAQSARLLHWAPQAVREEVTAGAFVTGSPSPEGRIEADGHAYRISGRWAGVPGAAEAEWFALPVWSGEVPTAVLLPAEAVRLGSATAGIGLDGAGCRDVHVDEAAVPTARVIDPFGPPPSSGGYSGTLPFAAAGRQAAVAVALGLARRALYEFASAARHRSRLGSVSRMAEQPLMRRDLNRVVQGFRAGRELLLAETARIIDSTGTPAGIPRGTRANLAAAQLHAQQAAHEAVRFAFTKAGGSALYIGHPLESRWRDSETVGQQWVFGQVTERQVTNAQFGDYVPQFVL
ncbi:acyl-CoA dehydrogenase family protein [Amycolatopsis antarctica]|nr:acyl-CoA dehydrogenase family protein [Amycolatopsis antarctica]